ncbi:BTB/POZ/MATH-domain protein [Rhynchospora pubera]|uniref:BTB/POZ/MATH-domain protein n=1 Tax=Rhynchospora pubera TaxID=906938 RepID=A0AAV8CB07_9POAL|nr:BTB/POZ/MATH-domain protein [Rhynchospora pubera]KAJ4752556.1 BTB/POZ/MATH-domain protein [Rhynchospora pubera]
MSGSVVDIREPETQSSWYTHTRTCSHLFKVTGYSLNKGIGVGNSITSGTFTLCGYDWTIQYYPDGNMYPEGYIAFGLNLKSNATKVRVKITLTMLSQTGGVPFSSSALVTLSSTNGWYSSPYFMKQREFEASGYLKHDYFTIRCTVSVIEGSPSNKTNCEKHSFVVQPFNLHQQLTCLLESGDGTDVTFNVSGGIFDAHRCVLAAVSPVFRAQFFGPMKGKVNQSIEIKDMEPSIFKSMLHFIYSDSIPELEKVKDNKDASIALAQHLLVAADRYGLERLKNLCEKKIYEFMDANNVATTFTLAEQHNCSELKVACLEFIKRPEVLAAVMQTEGFEHMTKSCPTILEELRSKNT